MTNRFEKTGPEKVRCMFYLIPANSAKLQRLMEERGETNLSAFINHMIEHYAPEKPRENTVEERLERIENLLMEKLKSE